MRTGRRRGGRSSRSSRRSTASRSSRSRSSSRIASRTSVSCIASPRRGCRPITATWRIIGYQNDVDAQEHVALVYGEIGDGENTLVRIHSKCLTGDVFHSLRCDCGWQLDTAMEMIAAEGPRRDRLSRSGRAGHRAAQQAQGVRAAGQRGRHGRGERAARLQARSAQLRHRRADPARPRAQVDSAHHQQSAQDGRPRGLRSSIRRARADRAAGARRER